MLIKLIFSSINEQSVEKIQNSSPTNLERISFLLKILESLSYDSLITLSPVKWPKLSFMNLKLSKSRKINAHLEFLFCLRYFSTCVKNTDLLHEKA